MTRVEFIIKNLYIYWANYNKFLIKLNYVNRRSSMANHK